MLAAYFIHPLGRSLPIWTIIDILVLPAFIYLSAKLSKQFSKASAKQASIFLASISFSTIAVDSLIRVFLLIPAELYVVLELSPEAVYFKFIVGAVFSYIEDAVAVLFSLLVGTPSYKP
jgi:hypothetical protein